MEYDSPEFDQIAYLDSILPPHEDSHRGLDVERFIYSLTFKESMVLLFLSMGFKRKEIALMLGYKRVQNINQVVLKIRKKYLGEQF